MRGPGSHLKWSPGFAPPRPGSIHRLKPLDRTAYAVTFTDEQWTRLQQAFPAGVCDWSRPPVGFQPSIPWLTYAGGPGGQPLGPAPESHPGPPK